MNKNANVFGTLCLGISMVGFAQQLPIAIETDSTQVQQLDEIVITDTRFKIKREQSGKTVIIISKAEIERNQGRTISELLNTKSGIEINGSRSVEGQNLGYFVRGGNNRQVLVLIDGVQVNDPSLVSNDFDLRLLDLNTIESIEIIKGAASTLYGNAAATAVINITTKTASSNQISASFLAIVGTNQTQKDLNYDGTSFTNNVSVSGSANRLRYVASFGNRFVDGLSAAKSDNPEKDPFSRYNTNLKLDYDINKAIQITAFASYDKFKTDIDGFPPPTFMFSDTEDTYTSDQTRFGLAPKFEYKNGSFQINSAISRINRETVSDFSTVNNAESVVVDAFNKYIFNRKFYTIVGLNYGTYKSEFSTNERFSNTDPYLNVVYLTDYGLNVNTGIRFNNHSEYGSHVVYSVNPSYNLKTNNGDVKVFGSYATSFIAPNLSQLFGFFGPNPNLKPEENRTIEGGMEFSNKKGFRMNGLYFNRKEENTIIFTNAYENAVSNATVHGVEVETKIKVFKSLAFNANYTFIELKNGTRLRLPKHKVNAGLGYNFSNNSYGSLNYQFVGKRMDTDFATFQNTALKSYALVDLYFSQKLINNTLKLFATITNVFNEDYLEIIGFTTKGRNVSLGLNISL
ncbi:MAG: TonB-dependent receptor [Flavobacteriales bacterium]|nr:TonB-dependent receptor [Flavobacteriia bacterium]NCP06435.1 TonB-dependent receptor [Flavobacteriales bacterium]PIV92488.1 MAG: TonB-dependent receptor [Flavobacteriaceae bacterium CG17_big_fil_post_rev_8_21_14_2_50_33_15]PIY13388.1 MAG: TonB-dependent receptor [Flavobacteriaceae bacterium CG_4_10_14_3_um_filter_33_47]PJB19715.1 MAG: TonB-dependent receptor [Flavobacteriaceae bacterium CG_4_9_14_3_um_filter_33_16]